VVVQRVLSALRNSKLLCIHSVLLQKRKKNYSCLLSASFSSSLMVVVVVSAVVAPGRPRKRWWWWWRRRRGRRQDWRTGRRRRRVMARRWRRSAARFSAARLCDALVSSQLSMVQSTDLDAIVEDRSSRDRLELRRERFDAERRKLNAFCNLPRGVVGPDISMSARNQTEQVSATIDLRSGSISCSAIF
jgi:hypothetical protein